MNKIYQIPLEKCDSFKCQKFLKYTSLNEKGINDVNKLESDWFVYYLFENETDGFGSAIFKKNDLYYLVRLDHCSCYGATDFIERYSFFGYNSVESLENICSSDLKERISCILKFIKKEKID